MKKIIDGFLGMLRPKPKPLPANDVQHNPIEALRAYIQRDLALGFYSDEQVLQQAIEVLEYDSEIEPKLLHARAVTILNEELRARAAEQENWPSVTDCDKLDAAFAELETSGVVTRQNFTCCGTCGASEIWDEIAAFEAQGTTARGYAFYHQQDTESAVDGSGLYLNYGATTEGEAAALKIANEIARRLEAHGFHVDWDGTWNKRISFAIDWKRRNLPLNAA